MYASTDLRTVIITCLQHGCDYCQQQYGNVADWDIQLITSFEYPGPNGLRVAGDESNAGGLFGRFSVDGVYQYWGGSELLSCSGDISSWNVSHVTNMNRVFQYATEYSDNVDSWDIDSWDVSKVTTMQNMFHSARAFNQPLNSWDVSQVTNMTSMFEYANTFNGNITGWDTSEVMDMTSMFKGYDNGWGAKTEMNQDLDGWDVSKVTSMESMFEFARDFKNDDESLASWDVSKVTNMRKIFKDGSGSLVLDLTTWNVSSVGLAGTTSNTSNMRQAFENTIYRGDFKIEENRHNLRCAWEPLVGIDVFRWAATGKFQGQTIEIYERWGTAPCT